MRGNQFDRFFAGAFVVTLAIALMLFGVAIVVAAHFIAKYW